MPAPGPRVTPAVAASRAAELLEQARLLLQEADELLVPLSATASGHDESALVECVERGERILAMAGAVQRRASVAYRSSRVRAQREAGVPTRDLGRGVAEEIALARRITPNQAANQIALARVLVDSMPRTLGMLAHGEISAWSADEVAKAVITLDDPDRARVDEDLAPRLGRVSAPRAGALARARAAELDQEAALARHRREVAQRSVSIRPVSDALVRVSALMPTPEGVAVYAALDAAARTARSAGCAGTRGQHMADALFTRVTGLERVEQAGIELQLLMTDEALLGGGAETAWIGGQPVPAAVARHLALGDGEGTTMKDPATGTAADATSAEPDGREAGEAGADDAEEDLPGEVTGGAREGATSGTRGDATGTAGTAGRNGALDPGAAARRWIRRLYTDPVTGALREADARRRLFTGAVRSQIVLRDQTCRSPWCDQPVEHVHHVRGYARGGETTIANGVGTCERFNLAVEMPGWSTRSDADGALRILTPAGREHASDPPPLRPPRARGGGEENPGSLRRTPSPSTGMHRAPPGRIAEE